MFRRNKFFFPVLSVLLIIVLIFAIAFGAVHIQPSDMFSSLKHFFSGQKPANIHEGVFIQLRLPRVLLCAITGAILAVSGVLMQGLFRNPIVEPGLVGTSAGAAFGASVVFVLSASLSPALKVYASTFLVPLMAFAGGLLATFSLRTPYYFQIFVAAIAIPAAFFLKEPQHVLDRTRLKMKEILSIVKLTYQQKEMRSAILISSLTGAATLTYAWFVQPYFQKAGVPVSVFGILWTLLNLSAGVFSMFSYRVERFLGKRNSLLFIVVFISLGFILTSLEISLAGIAILFGFYMVRGIATPVLKDQINQYTDSKVRATILSVRNLEIRLIFAAIGPVLGYLTDTFSLQIALMVTGIIYFGAAMWSILPFLKSKN